MEEIFGMSQRKPKPKYGPECSYNYALGDTSSKSKAKPVVKSACQRNRSQKKSNTDLIYEKIQELDDNAEVLDLVLPFRSLGRNSSLTNLNDLLQINDHTPSPLTHKLAKTLQLNEDTAVIMTRQIQQMKNSMEKLQQAVQKSYNHKLTSDIDFILGNIGNVRKNPRTNSS
ncbi:hypothetical protein RN001_010954 [Aquatica leii]|uniref:Uncharacterized protein n=1 Tax=Aquatica leii TaxID=1421715 RepID=A0AAN7QHU7_9COLE|nr:hypothetical protein RN001_010954 [Aquatica leii]